MRSYAALQACPTWPSGPMRSDGETSFKGNPMKIRALVTVLALACGTAFAAQYGTEAADEAANRDQAATTDSGKGGVVDKTKSAVRRLGDKIGNKIGNATTGKDKSKTRTAAKNDTRSMGAA